MKKMTPGDSLGKEWMKMDGFRLNRHLDEMVQKDLSERAVLSLDLIIRSQVYDWELPMQIP